jgi:hypothetical protein
MRDAGWPLEQDHRARSIPWSAPVSGRWVDLRLASTRRKGRDVRRLAFELVGTGVRDFHLLVRGRVRPFDEMTTIEQAVRKLQVAVKVAQGRIVLVDATVTTWGERYRA